MKVELSLFECRPKCLAFRLYSMLMMKEGKPLDEKNTRNSTDRMKHKKKKHIG